MGQRVSARSLDLDLEMDPWGGDLYDIRSICAGAVSFVSASSGWGPEHDSVERFSLGPGDGKGSRTVQYLQVVGASDHANGVHSTSRHDQAAGLRGCAAAEGCPLMHNFMYNLV